jgi:thioredoxin 1
MSDSDTAYRDGILQEDLDAINGPVLLSFGTNWCGHCQAAVPAIATALKDFPAVKYIAVEDGKGRKLGRSYTVKLWPTLVFLKDGKEQSRLVRPTETDEIRAALQTIS